MSASNKTETKVFNVEDLCRTCLNKVDVPINIFKYLIEGKLIANILEICTTIRVDAKDEHLPQKMCSKCLVSLAEAYSFSQKCHSSDEFLKRETVSYHSAIKEENDDECNEAELCKSDNNNHRRIEHNTDHTYEIDNLKLLEETEQDSECDKVICTDLEHQKIESETLFVCESCGEAFVEQELLASHITKHAHPNNYSCELCGRSFKFLHNLKTHIQSEHSDPAQEGEDKKHECWICHHTFKSRPLLSSHMKCHGERKFLCDDCGKRFKTQLALKLHIRVHTGEKPYKCEVCDKSFAQASSLAYHKRLHTGEKPYHCSVCSRAFAQAAHLRTHMKTHTGERPFSCPYCEKAFALKKNMIVHSRMHTGEKPYSCPICEKKFYDSSSMKKHHRGHKNVIKVEMVL